MPSFVKDLSFWMFLGKLDDPSNFDNYDYVNLHEAKPENAKKFWMKDHKKDYDDGAKKVQCCFSERVNQVGAEQSGAKETLQDGAKDIQQGISKRVEHCGAKNVLEDVPGKIQQGAAKKSYPGGGKQIEHVVVKDHQHDCAKYNMHDDLKHVDEHGTVQKIQSGRNIKNWHANANDNQNSITQGYESAKNVLHRKTKKNKAYGCGKNNHFGCAKDYEKTSIKDDEDLGCSDIDEHSCTKPGGIKPVFDNRITNVKDHPGFNNLEKTKQYKSKYNIPLQPKIVISYNKGHLFTPLSCLHVLPLSKDNHGGKEVTGAPKINPYVGKIISRAEHKYLKICPMQSSESFCNVCCDVELLSHKNSGRLCSEKSVIPGLVFDTKQTKLTDRNLIPLRNNYPKVIQYGDTSLFSVHTDDPRWAPGGCLNLSQYVGRFLMKKESLNTQKVFRLITSISK